jgi:hypothetical protein
VAICVPIQTTTDCAAKMLDGEGRDGCRPRVHNLRDSLRHSQFQSSLPVSEVVALGRYGSSQKISRGTESGGKLSLSTTSARGGKRKTDVVSRCARGGESAKGCLPFSTASRFRAATSLSGYRAQGFPEQLESDTDLTRNKFYSGSMEAIQGAAGPGWKERFLFVAIHGRGGGTRASMFESRFLFGDNNRLGRDPFRGSGTALEWRCAAEEN